LLQQGVAKNDAQAKNNLRKLEDERQGKLLVVETCIR
jgi:hypothetical protein